MTGRQKAAERRKTIMTTPPKPLFTTNLAWRVLLVEPDSRFNQQLIELAKRPELSGQFIPLIATILKALPPGDRRLQDPVLYTTWGLQRLKALATELTGGR